MGECARLVVERMGLGASDTNPISGKLLFSLVDYSPLSPPHTHTQLLCFVIWPPQFSSRSPIRKKPGRVKPGKVILCSPLRHPDTLSRLPKQGIKAKALPHWFPPPPSTIDIQRCTNSGHETFFQPSWLIATDSSPWIFICPTPCQS